jgi:hypothetical protein
MLIPEHMIKQVGLRYKKRTRKRKSVSGEYKARQARASIVWPDVGKTLRTTILINPNTAKKHALIGMGLLKMLGGELIVSGKKWSF